MTAYYNEFDPFAADWLENLILVGAIAPGIVDRRSIEDVAPSDLEGFTQCHFFAGIGVWSYALRQAGWPDDRPVWTASCPCQPFSQAGQGGGFDDERHLWPAFHHLAVFGQPPVIFGEQVSSKDGLAWLDLVQTDMEATGYAFGALDLCAAGVGAPHIRQRSYWMAHARGGQCQRFPEFRGPERDRADTRWAQSGRGLTTCREIGGLADPHDARLEGRRGMFECADQRASRTGGLACGLADADGGDAGPERQQRGGEQRQFPQDSGIGRLGNAHGINEAPGLGMVEGSEPAASRNRDRTGPTNGFWRDADWLGCRDGKWRPVEPGTFPLVNGAPNRVGSLRGYGNAIVAPLAQEFIEVAMEYLGG